MQELITWLVISVLTVSSFFVGFTSKLSCVSKRNEKQNLNMAGKSIVSFYRENDDIIEIDEEKYVRKVADLSMDENFFGGVFLYPGKITAVSLSGFKKEVVFSEDNTEAYRIFMVNKLCNEMAYYERNMGNSFLRVEIASKNDIENNNQNGKLYSMLGNPEEGDVTVFLLSSNEKYLNISGFTISFAK